MTVRQADLSHGGDEAEPNPGPTEFVGTTHSNCGVCFEGFTGCEGKCVKAIAHDAATEPAGKDRSRASYLGPHEMFLLDQACKPIVEAFGSPPYLVGSVMERPDYRDVDLRLILLDDEYARVADAVPLPFVNRMVTFYLRGATGLPIDFNVQQMTAANEKHGGKIRNPMGLRDLANYHGDGEPEPVVEAEEETR